MVHGDRFRFGLWFECEHECMYIYDVCIRRDMCSSCREKGNLKLVIMYFREGRWKELEVDGEGTSREVWRELRGKSREVEGSWRELNFK